jgi:3-oxoacyl-[acyl-carrier protein] reductase
MRNVLVTGGSRGIGLAITRRLAASGDYSVIAVARRESEDLGHAIRETGADRLHFRAFDLGRTDEIPAFVKELRDAFGAIYGLVNNAGIGTEGLLATMRNSEIEALIRLNVLSPIVLTKYVVRHMMADGAGRIVNISSIIASTGYNGLSVYAASKAAAGGSTRSLPREVGRPWSGKGDLLHITLDMPFGLRTLAEKNHAIDAIALRRHALALEYDRSFEDHDRLVEIILPVELDDRFREPGLR